MIFLLVVFLGSCHLSSKKTSVLTHEFSTIPSSQVCGLTKLTIDDDQRKTSLDLWVWYPVVEDSFREVPKNPYPWHRVAENGSVENPGFGKPLIVLSRGFAGHPEEYYWLIRPLVAAGYVVIATRHADLPGPQINHWHRALDVSLSLTEFFKTPLGREVDESRVGLVGFSLGGMTGLLLAGARARNLDSIVPDDSHVRERSITEGVRIALKGFDRERMGGDLSRMIVLKPSF